MVALVQRPAPTFTAASVADGLFQDISLSDYLGQWYEPLTTFRRIALLITDSFPRVVLLFYPM